MQEVIDIITNNQSREIDLSGYLLVIEVIEKESDSKPDVAIEACKSLIEGIAKKVIVYFDKAENDDYLCKVDADQLAKRMGERLSTRIPGFEADFIKRFVSLVNCLCEIRNKRGDVSHGKVYPKEEQSTAEFARLVASSTEQTLVYVLTKLYSIDFKAVEPDRYEDNSDYNDYLDEQYPELGIKYSRALYDQDQVSYSEGLLTFKDQPAE